MADEQFAANFEKDLWEIRDLLYGAVQAHMGQRSADALEPTKKAYERLSSLLDSSGGNLKRPIGD
jgi:hypothetical protein